MDQIQSFFPAQFRPFKRNLLREYLQYRILEAVFASDTGRRLAFLGGTAIHIVHGNPRFSEDLDFDSRDVSTDAFAGIASQVQRALAREGYEVELAGITRGHFRADLHFVGLLQRMGITGHREEKLLMHLDAQPQEFAYAPDQAVLNKFGVLCRVNVVPVDILLAQKIACILQRPRAIGRDFYDAIYLLGKTVPNAAYLAQKAGVESEAAMWEKLAARCAGLDFKRLAGDLEPFVAGPDEARRIMLFREFVAERRKASAAP